MIIFKKIRWKNFLSTGNSFIEIELDSHKSTLIIGSNGAGKSTILDALCFVLFGKAFRNINKTDLINSINGKDCVVEIEFFVGKKEYLVRRSQKPNKFEIYCDGEILPQTTDINETQTNLETNILNGFTFRTGKQIAFVGNASYVPFMQQTPAVRRDMVEDLLDIKIFSVMGTLLKDKMSACKNILQDADMRIQYSSQAIDFASKVVKQLEENNEEEIKIKDNKIKELENEIKELEILKTDCSNKIDELMNKTEKKDKFEDNLRKIADKERELEIEEKTLKKEIQFFLNNDSCSTCKQEILNTHKNNIIKDKENKLKKNQEDQDKCEELHIKNQNSLKIINDIIQETTSWRNKASSYTYDITLKENIIKSLRLDISKLKQKKKEIDTRNVEEAKKQLEAANLDKEEAVKEKEALDTVSLFLKDGGIKTQIIKQHISIINKLINKYLAAMDFFVNFEIDEQFNETIKSRYRDNFKYASFSEGEKMRIDLSILFSWRAIAKMRNSINSNILILDEVFESSLDSNGIDEFMKILNDLTEDTNTFIISHKGDQLFDKFNNVIKFEKYQSFSKLTQ